MKKLIGIGALALLLMLSGGAYWWSTQQTQVAPRTPENIIDTPGTATLRLGEEKRAGDIDITLKQIVSDTRCATDEVCEKQGSVTVVLALVVGKTSETITYSSDAAPYIIESRSLSIVSISPDARSNEVIPPSAYRIKFKTEPAIPPQAYAPTLPDYAVTDVYTGETVALDLTTYPDAEKFRTQLEMAVASGTNFAGHYAVASWGCGTGCQMSAVIDVKTGSIVAYGIPSEYGLSYSATSSLIIADPVENRPEEDDSEGYASAAYYVLKDGELQFLTYADPYTNFIPTCEPKTVVARNATTGETKQFGNDCAVPPGWTMSDTGLTETVKERDQTWTTYRFTGVSAKFRAEPDGYTLTESGASKDGTVLHTMTLTNTKELEAMQSSTTPSEAPPQITLMIIEKPKTSGGDLAPSWAVENPELSNLRKDASSTEPQYTDTSVGGLQGIAYTADGLYPTRYVVLEGHEVLYLISGSYLDTGAPIYADFDAFLGSLSLF